MLSSSLMPIQSLSLEEVRRHHYQSRNGSIAKAWSDYLNPYSGGKYAYAEELSLVEVAEDEMR